MSTIELVDQFLNLVNNAAELFNFCYEHHLFDFIAIGTIPIVKKKYKKRNFSKSKKDRKRKINKD